MNILLMIIRATRPSRTFDMPAVAKPFWIRKGYDALTFFGTIITHSQQEAEAFENNFDALKNHEMIHLYQARSTHDSWFCFYTRYLLFWLSASRYCRRLPHAGYRLNPFEMEAYRHMNNLNYLRDKREATGWRHYARLSLQERLELEK